METLKATIIGDELTLQDSKYPGEFIATWRGMTTATVAAVPGGDGTDDYRVTFVHPDGESDFGQETFSALWRAWHAIQYHTMGDFADALNESRGLSR